MDKCKGQGTKTDIWATQWWFHSKWHGWTIQQHPVSCFKYCCATEGKKEIIVLKKSRELVGWLKESGGRLGSQFIIIYTKKPWPPITRQYVLARKNYFSKIITENSGNTRTLFSTIDQLLNTAPTPPQFSTSKCEEHALLFNNKISSIRTTVAAVSGT